MEETITGMQSNGLQSCAKHWVAYEQETQRNPTYDDAGNIIQESVSSNLDDRTMHELYMVCEPHPQFFVIYRLDLRSKFS